MKSIFISTILVLVLSIGLLGYCLYRIDKKETFIKEKIGTSIVINKDTLVVVGYSSWEGCYLMSNGSKVDVEYLTKLQSK